MQQQQMMYQQQMMMMKQQQQYQKQMQQMKKAGRTRTRTANDQLEAGYPARHRPRPSPRPARKRRRRPRPRPRSRRDEEDGPTKATTDAAKSKTATTTTADDARPSRTEAAEPSWIGRPCPLRPSYRLDSRPSQGRRRSKTPAPILARDRAGVFDRRRSNGSRPVGPASSGADAG